MWTWSEFLNIQLKAYKTQNPAGAPLFANQYIYRAYFFNNSQKQSKNYTAKLRKISNIYHSSLLIDIIL